MFFPRLPPTGNFFPPIASFIPPPHKNPIFMGFTSNKGDLIFVLTFERKVIF